MNVLMPQLGETVAEGKITKWFKKAGDAVMPGDLLFEIETDKTSMEVPATGAGTLSAINVHAGEVAKVGAVVAVIGGAGGAPAATAAAVSAAVPSPLMPARTDSRNERSPDPRLYGNERSESASRAYPHMDLFREVRTPDRNFGPARLPGGIAVTPLARRLACEKGIDLSRVSGSGPHGRIVASDIENADTRRGAALAGPPAAELIPLYRDTGFTEIPLNKTRLENAARLTLAKQTIPHFYLMADVDLDGLLKAREDINLAAPNKNGAPMYRISINDFVVKALALALQRVPAANAVWAGDRMLQLVHSDIGIAVSTPDGPLMPLIRNAESKSLSAISSEMRNLAVRSQDGSLNPDECRGGSSAVSNLGMYGIREFTGVVVPPHATSLSIGAAERRPAENTDGSIRFVSRMTATLSCDHRVVDGAAGARLLAAFKGFIEQPVTMLV